MPARYFPLLLQRGSIQCLSLPASLARRLYFCTHLTAVIFSVRTKLLPCSAWLSMASYLLCSQTTCAQFSNQPVPRCSFTAFKLKAERVRESTQKKVEKKSESKHIQKVHAEPDFFHCGVSNIHHSKFKPDFQELMPQWFLL